MSGYSSISRPCRIGSWQNDQSGAESGQPATRPEKKRKKHTRSAPQFDLHSELKRIFGVDLTSIDGVDVMTAQTVLSELGPDLRAWESEAHFASWLNLTPKRDISGGKVIRQVREPARNRVATALRMAATSLLRSQSYLGARYRHLRMRLGAPKAIKAMARHLACLIYRLIRCGQGWVDRGARQFEEKRADRELEALRKKAARSGYRLVAEVPALS